jgi:transcriptional regulator with XRE-family HTH domain
MKTIYSPAYIRLLHRLKSRRIELQIRQQDLAAQLGVSPNWISKVEQRDVRLDVLQFIRLCRLLDLDPAGTLMLLEQEAADDKAA